jgi:hypothetical protein
MRIDFNIMLSSFERLFNPADARGPAVRPFGLRIEQG